MSGEAFRVDLRGIVDILSHHLYSSPRVYLRELIQNARDAVVARVELGEDAPRSIAIEVDEAARAVVVRDHGIGLTEDEMRRVLATIGASSKRGDLTQLRRQYLGQFGIGLLSCFLIADRIEVRSRSARSADAPTLSWVGSADGTFTISPAGHPLADAGTEVRVVARPDDAEWVEPRRVRLLAERFASLLDLPVTITEGNEPGEVVSTRTPPWRATDAEAAVWCQRELGFSPLASLPIEVPAAGVSGLAFIADTPGRVGNRKGDTVYSHGMFVADNNVQLVPGWAYFVRLAFDAGELQLTASRESLQDSPAVSEVRTQVGVQIRAGIERFAAGDPVGFERFMGVHAKGLLAMAASDTDMLELVMKHVPWETSEGTMTLERLLRGFDEVRYTTSMREFTTFAPILRARGTLLVNGAYVYGGEILRHVDERRGRIGSLKSFDAQTFLQALPKPADASMDAGGFRAHASSVLDRLGLDLDLREFAPATVPAMFVGAASSGEEDASDFEADPWADFLSEPEGPPARSRLVLNVTSPAVRALATLTDQRVRAEAITGLYVIGLLTAGEQLDERHSELLSGTLHALIAAAAQGTGTSP